MVPLPNFIAAWVETYESIDNHGKSGKITVAGSDPDREPKTRTRGNDPS
jgi:hypothetical protein